MALAQEPHIALPETAAIIEIRDVHYSVGNRAIFSGLNLSIPRGRITAIMGPSGTGKTTLFKVIIGLHPSETGSISISKDWRIGQVAQEAPGTEKSLIEIVLKADEERTSLLEEAETATDPTRISDIYLRLADIDAHTAESRAASILAGLGFSEVDQHSPASSFSGGWRMRVALAAVLFAAPDLLLLDEPTNHLDLESITAFNNSLKTFGLPKSFLNNSRY